MGVPGNADLLLLKTAAAAGGYQVSRSLRFNSADSAYLSRTPASAGNRKTWTWSGWVKRAKLGVDACLFVISNGTGPVSRGVFQFDSTDKLRMWNNPSGSSETANFATNAVFRDASAWYHIVLQFDTTQATSTERFKLYVNNERQTFSSAAYMAQNEDAAFNQAISHFIGVYQGSAYGDFLLADVWFLDGIAATPSDFAETNATTGQWVPKTYSGSKGSNGFHLEFADNSAATAAALGKDTANSNNWTPNNFSVTAGAGNDSLVDTPTSYGTDDSLGGSVRGNYSTWNPLDNSLTLSNGNLQSDRATASWASVRSTVQMSSGKWYWEVTPTAGSGTYYMQVGIYKLTATALNGDPSSVAEGYIYNAANGNKYNNNSSSGYGSSWTVNDVIGVAYDADNGNLYFYKNGSVQNSGTAAYTGLTGTFAAVVGQYGTCTMHVNFGQRAWAYTPPANYRPLVDTLLASPVVAKGNTAMDIILYTGNGSSRSLTGLNFSPDFIWQKPRSEVASHRIVDSVRGVDLVLKTNLTNAEATEDGVVDSFDSNGFTGGGTNAVTSGQTAVAWCWDAGTTTTTSTAGSITSSVRANASAGFSIVTYTNTGGTPTVGHGLGVAPKVVLQKTRNDTVGWIWYTTVIDGSLDYLVLNSTAAKTDSGAAAPTSTVFTSLGTAADYVAYCFAPVTGYSSFGSYVGNGSASDGPFVYTGFRPRWVMIKGNYSGGDWLIVDTARPGIGTYNVATGSMAANLSNDEGYFGANNLDILSNGFKIRSSNAVYNTNTTQYLYMAFAENPFQYARAR